MAFLFLWQFLLSGPMEIASAYIGVAQYLDYLSPGMTLPGGGLSAKGGAVVVALGVVTVALLYRRIASIARLTLFLWAGVMVTVSVVPCISMHARPSIFRTIRGGSPWVSFWASGRRPGWGSMIFSAITMSAIWAMR
jgi:hypothetical protein